MMDVHAELERHVLDAGFPCIGGQTSVRLRKCVVESYDYLAEDQEVMARLAQDLSKFVDREAEPRSSFSVHVAVDPSTAISTEAEFEAYLWTVLSGLHEFDLQPWDPRYSDHPDDASFKFSFAGRAFYIVGLNPSASRRARRFLYPALVFNPVWQFERLRDVDQLDRLIDRIRTRDVALQGSINPNLEYEGKLTDALQYSGMAMDSGWACPVSSFGGRDE